LTTRNSGIIAAWFVVIEYEFDYEHVPKRQMVISTTPSPGQPKTIRRLGSNLRKAVGPSSYQAQTKIANQTQKMTALTRIAPIIPATNNPMGGASKPNAPTMNDQST
jgi:hypothetical protein